MSEEHRITTVLGPHYEARFWAKVQKTETCWLWTGAKDAHGYGQFGLGRIHKKPFILYAHRLSYEMFVGPIPAQLILDHLCRVPHCINPAHLEAVTLRENILRGESLPARNARKVYCIYGHSFVNAYREKGGKRRCRTCVLARQQRERDDVVTGPIMKAKRRARYLRQKNANR